MTMIVSLFSDLLRTTTMHLYLCYLLSTLAFSQQSGLAGSLWNLFRGMSTACLMTRSTEANGIFRETVQCSA